MKNTLLGNTGLSVSPVGMGVLPIGPNQRNLPLKEGAQVIKYALGRGINFIDTAQYYRTYPYIREAMRQLKDEPDEKQLEVAIAAMKAVLPENDTPYFEGLCDLNGEPLREEEKHQDKQQAEEEEKDESTT